MRFYYQGSNADGNKVATKCMRVPNTASTMKVVEELIQKFCLESHTPSSFTLYEVHSHTGESSSQTLKTCVYSIA